jgi:hypothetical protein
MPELFVRYVKWEVVSRQTGEKRLMPYYDCAPNGTKRGFSAPGALAMARHYARETQAGAEVVDSHGKRVSGGEYYWDPDRGEVVRVREVLLKEGNGDGR